MEPFVTNSTTMQSSWSTRRGYLPTLGLTCQLMCTFWPAFIPQGHKELTRILYSRFTPLFPKVITNKCLLRLQHLAMRPSVLLRKQPRSWGLFRNTPSHGLDKTKSNAFVRRRQTSISLVPAKSAGAARNCAEPEFLGNKRPKSRTIMARSSNTSGRITGSTRISSTIDEKTTIEALQFLATFGATPKQISVHRTVR